jgi:hypothetical protein
MVMTWAMATAMRLTGDEEGKGKGGKGNGKGDTRVAGDEEGEDGKAVRMATRMVGEWTVTARKRVIR